ncbi:hypothetical protein LZ578_04655 [Jeotgalibaca sp. MA1X17-3]|uniref:hypothetical protein n=1 Tax=Jeotgalibaca sp. MA1X17-3 TaxID=2908211 RepID=UPI001F1CD459|nr:hypothetical protein [Jeotgalibaca sp. MA1X17-3]UJF16408.1 hypothetical protein LZ578_04655 [Jeotgalibaca sp. MA1X17-3]
MKKDHILMTRIFLDQSFSDVALYSGILYLWKDKKTLHLYDWNRWMNHIPFGDVPIYQNPFPFQKISTHINDIHSCFIKEILFEKEVRDFFIYNHDLYYLTEDGFFVLTPESGTLQSDLISTEKFYSLSLSDMNRVALSGGESGVFEYFLSDKNAISKGVHQWDPTPTYSTEWDGHHLLQLDENKAPVQLLHFYIHKNIFQIERKIPKKELKKQIPFYNESLNLQYHEETNNWNTLFQYLPPEETNETDSLDVFQSREIPVIVMPSLFFAHPLLQENTLYIEENKQGLFLMIQNDQYLHVPHTDYIKWSTYPKSRNYQNHFHLLSEQGITFFYFMKWSKNLDKDKLKDFYFARIVLECGMTILNELRNAKK